MTKRISRPRKLSLRAGGIGFFGPSPIQGSKRSIIDTDSDSGAATFQTYGTDYDFTSNVEPGSGVVVDDFEQKDLEFLLMASQA